MAEQELIELITNGLKELALRIEESRTDNREQFQQIDRRFEQIDARFQQIDRRFEQIDAHFERIDRRFEEVDAHFERVDRRFEQVDARFERADGKIGQIFVQIEGLRGDIRLVAEGVANVDEKLDRHARENERQFDDVRATIQLSHTLLMKRDDELDARLTILETTHQ